MNIFFLDQNPQRAARMHCDTHVVKMILESAQMLCTTHNLAGDPTPYRTTHANHPCTKWVRRSQSNYDWLMRLTFALHDEWQYRYDHEKDHKSIAIVRSLKPLNLPQLGLTPPALALPLDCIVYSPEDLIQGRVLSYRRYYAKYKSHLLSYRKGYSF